MENNILGDAFGMIERDGPEATKNSFKVPMNISQFFVNRQQMLTHNNAFLYNFISLFDQTLVFFS